MTNLMNGKDIKAILATINTESMTNGSMSELWADLPDFISGGSWVEEIHDMAWKCAEWLTDDQDYTDDITAELPYQLAESEVEDYYASINKRVQDLSLWAYGELDDEVEELSGPGSQTLTDLNSLYLYAAMRGLAYRILFYAITKAADLESAI